MLAQTLPVTLCLGGTAFLLASLGGVWLGALAAMHKQTWRDYGAMFIALAAISLPAYIVGPLLILIFALTLGWFPAGGWGGASHLILPTITLAAPAMAVVARLMRGSMVETLGQDFIRTARAKGLNESTIVFRHALRIALLPVVSYLGPLAAHLLTGSIVVETVFNIPGAGGFFVHSILNRDGFLLGGMVIVYCVMLVVFNLVVDLAYSFLDPRIQADV
jgi:oligopeptide transport system permease protein